MEEAALQRPVPCSNSFICQCKDINEIYDRSKVEVLRTTDVTNRTTKNAAVLAGASFVPKVRARMRSKSSGGRASILENHTSPDTVVAATAGKGETISRPAGTLRYQGETWNLEECLKATVVYHA